MELDEILELFEWTPGKFPQSAVDDAVARREEITPALLEILKDVADNAAEIDGDYMAHQFAMFLLAQFRETSAYPLLLRIAALPEEDVDRLLGDTVNEDLGRLLASVGGGDVTGLQELVENESASRWSRIAALDGLVTLVAAGIRSREEILAYFGELLQGKLRRTPDEEIWGALVCSITDLYPIELLDGIRKAYEEDLVETRYVDLADVERQITEGKESTLERLAKNMHFSLVVDAAGDMRRWACGRDERPRGVHNPFNMIRSLQPIKRAEPKVGRNEPCPCGSGKKYKKCHGA